MNILEIELLTTGLEVGLPAFHFQLRSQNVITVGAKRFVLHACLDKEVWTFTPYQ